MFLALAIGLAWPSIAARPDETRLLPPSGKWIVDYADDSCRLVRKFGDGDRAIVLILDQFGPGDRFRITFMGKSVEPRRQFRPIEVVLRFGPNESEFEASGIPAVTRGIPTFLVDGTHRLAPPTKAEQAASDEAYRRRMQYEPPPVAPHREKAATRLEVRKLLRFDVVLETGRMDRPLAALRHCAWDTVRTWGLDVEQQKSLTRKPFPKNSNWFRPDDYPSEMLRQGYDGVVNYRVMVDETGKPTSCKIQTSTRPKEFDEVVCRSVMRRAEFDPALDAHGKPVRSFWRQTVNFRISDW